MASKATSIDIAYRAGVSQSTVSRALRNSPLVNLETRQRIQAIAKELNYKVDKNASNLLLHDKAMIYWSHFSSFQVIGMQITRIVTKPMASFY